MRALLHVALHDLRLHLAERSNLFFLLLMPLGFVVLFGTVMGGQSDGPEEVRVSLPVVDADGGFLADAFVEQLREGNFEVQVYSAAEADTTSFGTRFLTIPAGFTDRILAGEQVDVELRKRSDSNVSYDMAASVRVYEAQARFLGNLVRWQPVETAGVTGPAAIGPAERGRFLALVAESSQVTVESTYAGRGRPVPSGMGQSAPGMMVMFVVMTVLIGGSQALTLEKEKGTLRRLAATPLARWQILGGKVAGLTFLGLCQAAILIVCTELMGRFHVLGIDFVWAGQLPAMLVVLLPFCFCIAAIGLLMGGLFRTTQQAESLSWLIGLIMSALGGAWWPLEVVPDTMRKVAHVLPTAWALDGLHAVITFGQGAAGALQPALVVLGMGLLFLALGVRTLRVEG